MINLIQFFFNQLFQNFYIKDIFISFKNLSEKFNYENYKYVRLIEI